MITCPKCGFHQPEDRFCASCGVDMEKYQTRHKTPVMQRVLGSYIFQAALIVAIVVGTSAAIYRKKKADIQKRLKQIEILVDTTEEPLDQASTPQPHKAVEPIRAAPSPDSGAKTDEPTTTATTTSPASTTLAAAVTPAETESLTAPAGGKAEAGKAVGTADGPGAPTFHIVLAEASIGFLNRMGDLRPLSGQGTINGAVVPALETHVQPGRTSQEVRTIDEEKLPAQIGTAVDYNKVTTDEALNMPMGLEVRLRPTSIDERGLHFSLTLTRTLRESAASTQPPTPQRYHENVILANHAGLFVYGFLPKRRTFPTVESILPEFIQDLMNSPEFLSGTSDLVLFVEGTGLPEFPAR